MYSFWGFISMYLYIPTSGFFCNVFGHPPRIISVKLVFVNRDFLFTQIHWRWLLNQKNLKLKMESLKLKMESLKLKMESPFFWPRFPEILELWKPWFDRSPVVVLHQFTAEFCKISQQFGAQLYQIPSRELSYPTWGSSENQSFTQPFDKKVWSKFPTSKSSTLWRLSFPPASWHRSWSQPSNEGWIGSSSLVSCRNDITLHPWKLRAKRNLKITWIEKEIHLNHPPPLLEFHVHFPVYNPSDQ